MRIGLISDTHWSRPSQYLDLLDRRLAGVDCILHAGDLVEEFVLERLEEIAPVLAVRGNCDGWELQSRLSHHRVLEWEGVLVGMFHGWEVDLRNPQAIVGAFPYPDLRVIIHGHTHLPANYHHGGVTIFNPGSPSQPRGGHAPSLGLLTVQDGAFELCHLGLEQP